MLWNLVVVMLLGQAPQCEEERSRLRRTALTEAGPTHAARLSVELACDAECASRAINTTRLAWKTPAGPLFRQVLVSAKASEASACSGPRSESPPSPEVARLLESTLRGQSFAVGARCAVHIGGYKLGNLWLDGAGRWQCIWVEAEWERLSTSAYGRAMMGRSQRPEEAARSARASGAPAVRGASR